MPTSLRLIVTTPAETILDVPDVRWVQARLADGGGIGIWPGHAPLLAETVAAPPPVTPPLLSRAGVECCARQVTHSLLLSKIKTCPTFWALSVTAVILLYAGKSRSHRGKRTPPPWLTPYKLGV
jgi:hypothetical protein